MTKSPPFVLFVSFVARFLVPFVARPFASFVPFVARPFASFVFFVLFVARSFAPFVFFVLFVAMSFVSFVALRAQVRDAPAQVQAAGTAVIRGVVRSDKGEPIRRAVVEARGPVTVSAVTDDRGRFELKELPPGRYTGVQASKPGFVSMKYGQPRPESRMFRMLTLASGQEEDVDLALPRGAAIAGRVVDDSGEIITGASVRLFRYASDRSTLEEIERWPIPELTDDLGEFRLFGVQSGAVFLSVEAPSPTGFGTVIALYPGVLSLAEAQPIQLRPGEEVSGLTVTIGRAKTASLSVVLRTPDGQVAAGESVTLQGPVPGGSRSRQQRSRTDGTTRFPNVAAGEYIVAVYKNPPSNLVAKARVVMDGDDVVLPLTVRTPDSLRGRFVSDTGAPLPEIRPRSSSVATSILTALESPNHTSPTFSVRADGRFEATDLNGRYMFWPGSPHSDWAVKSVRIAGADVTDAPFEFNGQDIDGVEVVLTQRISTLVVSVSELAGDSTLLGGGVLVFAEDATKWGTGRWAVNRFVRAADVFGGRSSIRLPPARYLVVALDDLSLGYDGGDRTHLLERLRPIATAVTLEEGESKSIEVPMLSVP